MDRLARQPAYVINSAMIFDVAIIGGGIMGASAAYYLAQRGASVCLLERDQAPSPRAASTDRIKVFRQSYPDEFYVKLASEAWPLWQELEHASNEQLSVSAGLLLTGQGESSIATQCYKSLQNCNVPVEHWRAAETVERFPQFLPNSFDHATYEPGASVFYSERATRACLNLARQAGVEILEDSEAIGFEDKNGRIEAVVVESGERIECRTVLVTAGPWTRALLTALTGILQVTRQPLIYLAPAEPVDFRPGNFPIFINFESGFYGMPDGAGGVKASNHHPGPDVGRGFNPGEVGESFIQNCRDFFSETIPGLKDAPVVDSRVCLYNITPDEDFIIDTHPEWGNCWIATGFSGHGFKFGPLIGRSLAELATTGITTLPLDRFKLSRFWDR